MSQTQIPADQKRALTDLRCACRKLAALFESRGEIAWADATLRFSAEASQRVEKLRKGGAA